MVTEDYVSFETAKLLKEKGFSEWCFKCYGVAVLHNGADISFDEECELKDEGRGDEIEYVEGGRLYDYGCNNRDKDANVWAAPTLWVAVKWLQKTHHILVVPDYVYECTDTSWVYKIYRLGENGKPERCAVKGVSYDDDNNPTEHIVGYRDYELSYKSYATREEACEAAIKYCLSNLIKNEDEEEESDIPVPKTVDEAISTLEKILSDEDREYLLKNGAISMHDSLGRWIRNEWGLWTGSELKDELMNMNKGLNHPDDMSNYIIEEFIKYWNNKV